MKHSSKPRKVYGGRSVPAARLISIAALLPHGIAHAWYQDAELAMYYIEKSLRNAAIAGDDTLENFATIVGLSIAAEVGDAPLVERLLNDRKRQASRSSFGERDSRHQLREFFTMAGSPTLLPHALLSRP